METKPSASNFAKQKWVIYVPSPEDAYVGVLAALRALLEVLGPVFPFRMCPAGVVGRDVSGVAIGVDSFEVKSL